MYHIRQNRVLSLEIKLEMASNPQFFFVSFHPLLLFILCKVSVSVFVVLFCYDHYYFTATTTTTHYKNKWIYKS